MKCYIGLGSNLGERRSHLQKAIEALTNLSTDQQIRLSSLYENPALVLAGAPAEWRLPFLNAVAEIDWKGSSMGLLQALKQIEAQLGRGASARWAPRIIDLDLLTFGNETLQTEKLTIPHPGILQRSFVLDPLKDLAPDWVLPGASQSVVVQARTLKSHLPLIMGIVNLTPDSFSDGGELAEVASLEVKLKKMIEQGVAILDLGAESTRPRATPTTVEEEWQRLQPALLFLQKTLRSEKLRPLISVDTRKPEIARRALELGADWINDVAGFSDPEMVAAVKDMPCDCVVMHSLTVPADPKLTWSADVDPIQELKQWIQDKLQALQAQGISQSRIIFDPGLGFGKTAHQSIEILKRMQEFAELPVRILVGHSRKSFLKVWGLQTRESRDAATLGVSLALAQKGVDVLRVHDFENHLTALRAHNEVLS